MSIDYAYYKVRKGSPMFKLIAKFYEERGKQQDARLAFIKAQGFDEFLSNDRGILGFKMAPKEAAARDWVIADRRASGYYRPRAKGDDAAVFKQMGKLPAIGAMEFTHGKKYLAIDDYLRVGLHICSITPLALDGHYVLSVPLACVGKEFKPEDHAVRELKMSEFRALQAAEEKKAEGVKHE